MNRFRTNMQHLDEVAEQQGLCATELLAMSPDALTMMTQDAMLDAPNRYGIELDQVEGFPLFSDPDFDLPASFR